MKEHALFLRAGFTPPAADFSKQAEFYKNEFGKLLCETVALSNGVVSPDVLNSGEVVTEFTALAEKQTECFTGIAIDRKITSRECAFAAIAITATATIPQRSVQCIGSTRERSGFWTD